MSSSLRFYFFGNTLRVFNLNGNSDEAAKFHNLKVYNSIKYLETMEDTMSITTSTSDYERQQMLLEAINLNSEEDIFTNAGNFLYLNFNFLLNLDIVVAEEASMVDEQNKMEKRKNKFFEKEVNSLEASLTNTNFVLIISKQFNDDEQPLSHECLVGRGFSDR